MKPFVLALALATLAVSTPAFAQYGAAHTQNKSCPAWSGAIALSPSPEAANAPDVRIGQGYSLTLSPAAQVVYPVAPDQPVVAGTFGGLLALTIKAAGSYHVLLDGPAHVALIKDGEAVAAVSSGQADGCEAMVYKLDAGLYSLQVVNAGKATLRFEIALK